MTNGETSSGTSPQGGNPPQGTVLPAGVVYPDRQTDSDSIKKLKIENSTRIYNFVVAILGATILAVILVSGIIIAKGIGNPNPATIPDGLIAIGSAAIGALAGLLAQTPASAG
jgi:hypothetical protein